MADAGAQARIEDLKRRIELDPGSRLFLALAEEYRKSGRLADALSTLQRGLLAHPNYLSAQVALGKAYLESGQATEAIATFSKVLVADPGNLVSAKSLADVYLSRGETLEAVKKYKLYRALSGDRSVEEVIARLERQLAPGPPAPPAVAPRTPVPPPPTFVEEPAGPVRRSEAVTAPSPPVEEPFDLSPVSFEPPELPAPPALSAEPFASPAGEPPAESAPAPAPLPDASADVATRALRVSEILGSASRAPRVEAPPVVASLPRRQDEPEAQGRTLADLYFAQGHYAEALRIYDELVTANPFDEELRRLRRDAEARLLPAGSASTATSADAAFERRLKRIRALRQWLSVLQAG
ncbi:MAG: tetratricopeptide repeat protein [Acidobacteriota bacterium]